MPLGSILFLALVIGALILFAVALAYGDWATRQAMRQIGAAPKVVFHQLNLPHQSRTRGALSEPIKA